MNVKKINIENTFIWIFCIIQMFDCFSIYYKLWGYRILQVANILICLLLLYLHKDKLFINKKNMLFLFYFSFVSILLIIFGNFRYLGYLSGHVIPIILFYCYLAIGTETQKMIKIIRCFSNLILIVCVFSLIFYLAGSVFNLIAPSSIVNYSKVDWADFDYSSYFGLYFEGQKTFFFGKTILRNIGIFVEAPVFGYLIITVLYNELFLVYKANMKKISIILVTIVTTFSSTAIAIGLVIIFVYVYKYYMKKSIFKLLIPVALIFVSNIVYKVIIDKLSLTNMSGTVRIDDLMACLKCFINNPIIGVGFNNVRGLDPFRASFRQVETAGVSNGLPFVLACGGVILGSLYFGPIIIGTIKALNRKFKIEYLGLIAVQFILLIVTVTEFTLFAETFLVISWFLVLNTSYNINYEKREAKFKGRRVHINDKNSINHISRAI